MPKNLVIVESPAKAKTIEKFLGGDFKVVSSNGHISDLPSSELGIDVENNFQPKYQVSKEKKEIVKKLKNESKKVDVVWLASDEDREGEAIAWHLKESLAKENDNFSRVRFNQITRDSIQEAFKEPLEIDTNLVNAQQARRFLDRVVGFELSPLLWAKVARNLSAGRVQSVALRLLVEREKKIREFKPEEFWEVSFTGSKNNQPINFSLVRRKTEPLLKEVEAKHIESLILNSDIQISEVIKKPTT